MKAIRDFARRQWCRIGLNRWNDWKEFDDYDPWTKYRNCRWCNYVQERNVRKYTIGEILMTLVKRIGND